MKILPGILFLVIILAILIALIIEHHADAPPLPTNLSPHARRTGVISYPPPSNDAGIHSGHFSTSKSAADTHHSP